MADQEGRPPGLGLGLREDAGILVGVGPEEHVVEVAPAKTPETPAEWIRQNLFSSWWNGLLTLFTGAVTAVVLFQLLRFVFVTGEWSIIRERLDGYMTGSFPPEELWRLWVCIYFIALLAGLSWGASQRKTRLTPRRIGTAGFVALLFAGFFAYAVQTSLVRGLIAAVLVAVAFGILGGRALGWSRLRVPLRVAWVLAFPIVVFVLRYLGDGVAPRFWQGFMFNVLAATVGIFASFPVGVALALGRRSSLPAVRMICVGFIEVFRGAPLVAWLVFAKYVVDLMLPPQLDLPDIIKSFIAMTLFSSAYVAEIVRGGLQSVPAGQYEAGRALGLSTTRLTGLIVMPQALRATIPAMISHFISLFKDTSLFSVIEVAELLEVARKSVSDPHFLELGLLDKETLLFAALVFWIVAFTMSRWSQRLEVRLGVGER